VFKFPQKEERGKGGEDAVLTLMAAFEKKGKKSLPAAQRRGSKERGKSTIKLNKGRLPFSEVQGGEEKSDTVQRGRGRKKSPITVRNPGEEEGR